MTETTTGTTTDMMTVSAPITRVNDSTIRLERLLDAPPETVWDYLTRDELRRTWFMPGTDARPDGEFDMTVDHHLLSDETDNPPANYADMKGATWTEKVLRFDPPRLLETTFQGGKHGEVRYELKPEGARTRLVLTHSNITSPTGFQDFGSGWNSHMTVLQERLAGRSVHDFWALHARSKEAVRSALG